MYKSIFKIITILVLFLILFVSQTDAEEKHIEKTFKSPEELRLKLVLGGCLITKSEDKN